MAVMTGFHSTAERRWLPRFLAVGPLRIPYVSRDKAIEGITSAFKTGQPLDVTFCNAHTMLMALESKAYSRTLGTFLVLNDGVGVDLASRLFGGGRFEDNLNGTDFVPDLLARTAQRLDIYLLGGRPGVAEAAGEALVRRFPQHRIVGTRHGYVERADVPAVLADINGAQPDLVLVGMGNPRQEEFIATWRQSIDATVMIGVGALLDFMGEAVPRAPAWVRRARVEWLFRLTREPHRLWRRYTVGVASFLASALRLRMRRAMGGSCLISILEGSPSRLRLLPPLAEGTPLRRAEPVGQRTAA